MQRGNHRPTRPAPRTTRPCAMAAAQLRASRPVAKAWPIAAIRCTVVSDIVPQDPIDSWNRGELSATKLIQAFQPELISILHKEQLTGELNRVGEQFRQNQIAGALRRCAREGRKFSSSEEFLAWAAAEIARAGPYRLEWISRYAGQWRDARTASTEKVSRTEPLLVRSDEPEHEEVDLMLSISELAQAADRASEDELPLVRLLALRVIGGWSLKEIAKRDESSIDIAAERWVEARAWIQQRAPKSSTASRIVTFDLLDLRIIQTLMADKKLLATLDWRAFEKMLATVLATLEYEIELQRGTKDGGVDILAIKKDSVFGAHRYLLQAKRWSQKVGVEPVRELLFLQQHYGATKACLATTSTFTSGAWQLGEEYRWQLELRDYEKLQEWVALSLSGALKA